MLLTVSVGRATADEIDLGDKQSLQTLPLLKASKQRDQSLPRESWQPGEAS